MLLEHQVPICSQPDAKTAEPFLFYNNCRDIIKKPSCSSVPYVLCFLSDFVDIALCLKERRVV